MSLAVGSVVAGGARAQEPPPLPEQTTTVAPTTVATTTATTAATIPAATIPAATTTAATTIAAATTTLAPLTTPSSPGAGPGPDPSATAPVATSIVVPPSVLLDGPGSVVPGSSVPPQLPPELLPVGPFGEPLPPFSLAPTTLPALPADPTGQNLQEDPSEAPPQRIGVPDAPYTAPISPFSYQQVLAALTAEQRAKVTAAQARADEAAAKVTAAQQALNALNDQRDRVLTDVARIDTLREATQDQMRARALRLYTGEQTQMLAVLLDAQDASTFGRRSDIVNQAQQSDAELVGRYRSTRLQLQERNEDLDDIAERRRAELAALQAEQAAIAEELRIVQEALARVESRGALSFGGMFFPVQLPVSFVDTYGAPRMQGTQYYHWHQGTDIFAPMGTPLRAVQRGIISVVGARPLGGNRLWLEAADGTQYYYAHLSAYAPDIRAGSVVEAGQIIGYVGDTGNAKGTPAHLHFEIHPDPVSGPINPYPVLKAIQNADAEEFLKATLPSLPPISNAPSVPTTAPSTIPGQTTTTEASGPLPTRPVPTRLTTAASSASTTGVRTVASTTTR